MDNTDIFQKLQNLEEKIDKQTELLVKVNKIQKIGLYTRYAYWGLFILISFGAFYFINPFLSNLKDMYLGNVSILQILDNASSPDY